MLMNPLKAIISGWQVTIQADTTFKICREDVALLGFGVNSMGAKYHLCVLSLIPNSSEDQQAYSETWRAVDKALDLLLRNYRRCPMKDCAMCDIISVIVELLREDVFHVPVTLAGSDNSVAFANFVAADLPQARALQCFSHLTGTYLYLHLCLA